MDLNTRDIPAFERWCTDHKIEIDERLEIRAATAAPFDDDSISVYTKPNVNVAIGESLVRIPKAMVFSTVNCSTARELAPWLERADPAFELSLAFIIEERLGPRSPWHGYFLCLPRKVVDIAIFWHLHGGKDGLEARQWLRGTEAERILTQPEGTLTFLERIDDYFETVAKPVLKSEFGIASSLLEFHRAYSIVSSRAFLVDACLGLSLVPVADIFNHVEDNHVHLEADYHVCPICGSFQECGHDDTGDDDDDDDNNDNNDWQPVGSNYTADDICEMVANLPIGGDEEVYNMYDDTLTNARLLCHYGFMLDGNENDVITWTTDEVLLHLVEGDAAAKTELEGSLSREWKLLTSRLLDHWSGSARVYNPITPSTRKSQQAEESGGGTAIEVNNDGGGGPGGPLTGSTTRDHDLFNPTSGCLNLNADGQVSLQLWVTLFLISLANVKHNKNTNEEAIELMTRTAERQVQIEEGILALEEGYVGDPGSSVTINEGMRRDEGRALKVTGKEEAEEDETDISEISIVRKIAELVVQICGRRLQSVYAPGQSEIQIGEMIDDIPEEEKRLTRVGMKYALENRRILRSCQSSWTELTGFVQERYMY